MKRVWRDFWRVSCKWSRLEIIKKGVGV